MEELLKFMDGVVRAPALSEWAAICRIMGPEADARLHCEDSYPFWADCSKDGSVAQVCFPDALRSPEYADKTQRTLSLDDGQEKRTPIGFRPAFVVPSYLLDYSAPGAFVVLNVSMLMNEEPIPCGKWSFRGEDIPDYVPGAVLETQRLLHSPISYIRTYYAGRPEGGEEGKALLIADRVLLKNISFHDLYVQGYAGYWFT